MGRIQSRLINFYSATCNAQKTESGASNPYRVINKSESGIRGRNNRMTVCGWSIIFLISQTNVDGKISATNYCCSKTIIAWKRAWIVWRMSGRTRNQENLTRDHNCSQHGTFVHFHLPSDLVLHNIGHFFYIQEHGFNLCSVNSVTYSVILFKQFCFWLQPQQSVADHEQFKVIKADSHGWEISPRQWDSQVKAERFWTPRSST